MLSIEQAIKIASKKHPDKKFVFGIDVGSGYAFHYDTGKKPTTLQIVTINKSGKEIYLVPGPGSPYFKKLSDPDWVSEDWAKESDPDNSKSLSEVKLSDIKDDSLAHHGIKGQKWGVSNGPPYPLKPEVHDRVVRGDNKPTGASKPSGSSNRAVKGDLLGTVIGGLASGAAYAIGEKYLKKSDAKKAEKAAEKARKKAEKIDAKLNAEKDAEEKLIQKFKADIEKTFPGNPNYSSLTPEGKRELELLWFKNVASGTDYYMWEVDGHDQDIGTATFTLLEKRRDLLDEATTEIFGSVYDNPSSAFFKRFVNSKGGESLADHYITDLDKIESIYEKAYKDLHKKQVDKIMESGEKIDDIVMANETLNWLKKSGYSDEYIRQFQKYIRTHTVAETKAELAKNRTTKSGIPSDQTDSSDARSVETGLRNKKKDDLTPDASKVSKHLSEDDRKKAIERGDATDALKHPEDYSDDDLARLSQRKKTLDKIRDNVRADTEKSLASINSKKIDVKKVIDGISTVADVLQSTNKVLAAASTAAKIINTFGQPDSNNGGNNNPNRNNQKNWVNNKPTNVGSQNPGKSDEEKKREDLIASLENASKAVNNNSKRDDKKDNRDKKNNR